MENILVLLSHPDYEKSVGNKTVVEQIASNQNVTVRHLDKTCEAFKVDVKEEQVFLKEADVIVFQFPLFWYGVPGLMKEYIDQVFTYGFAFGKGNYHLEGKKIAVSFTTGSSITDYPDETIDKIVFPIKGLAEFCKMNYIGEVVSHEIGNFSDEAIEKAKNNAINHANKLNQLISNQ